MTLAMRTRLKVLYENVNITKDITPYVESCTFTDSLEEADDLQLNLTDPEGLWSGSWAPDQNAKLSVDIIQEIGEVRNVLPCGLFYIDTCGEDGLPTVASIKATSADCSSSLRREAKTRAWENVSLQRIAQDVASAGGLSLQYLSGHNPTYKRIEQKAQSDLGFIQKLVNKEALRVKVSNSALVIFDPEEYDSQPALVTYSKPKTGTESDVVGWNLASEVSLVYSACEVSYRDPKSKKLLSYTYAPPGAPSSGATLRKNVRCDSQAHAQRLAKGFYDQANRAARTAGLTVIGDTRLVVGVNIALDATWGRYAGKYAVEKATHAVWKYTTALELRRIA